MHRHGICDRCFRVRCCRCCCCFRGFWCRSRGYRRFSCALRKCRHYARILRSACCLGLSFLCMSIRLRLCCMSCYLFALRSRCCCSSSSVDGRTLCPVRCSVKSLACLDLSGSCLSNMASISGVSVAGSLILLPCELDASEMEPSLILSLLRPNSWLCSSLSG